MVGEEGGDGGELVVSEEPEETDPVRTLPTPKLPSRSEIEQHEVDHIPHENWCDHCASVFGREAAHTCSAEPREIPVVSLD